MDYLLQAIANYGFPMAAASFLLVRLDKRLADLNMTMQELTRAVEQSK